MLCIHCTPCSTIFYSQGIGAPINIRNACSRTSSLPPAAPHTHMCQDPAVLTIWKYPLCSLFSNAMHNAKTSPENLESSNVPAAPWTTRSVGYLESRSESKAHRYRISPVPEIGCSFLFEKSAITDPPSFAEAVTAWQVPLCPCATRSCAVVARTKETQGSIAIFGRRGQRRENGGLAEKHY